MRHNNNPLHLQSVGRKRSNIRKEERNGKTVLKFISLFYLVETPIPRLFENCDPYCFVVFNLFVAILTMNLYYCFSCSTY
jgi:hypothetical protein